MLAQGYFEGQRSSIIHILQLFMTLCDMQSSSGNYSMSHQVPMVSLLLLVYQSAVSYISVEISLGSCWRGDILKGHWTTSASSPNFFKKVEIFIPLEVYLCSDYMFNFTWNFNLIAEICEFFLQRPYLKVYF